MKDIKLYEVINIKKNIKFIEKNIKNRYNFRNIK